MGCRPCGSVKEWPTAVSNSSRIVGGLLSPLAAVHNCFVVESFIDALAAASKQDHTPRRAPRHYRHPPGSGQRRVARVSQRSALTMSPAVTPPVTSGTPRRLGGVMV